MWQNLKLFDTRGKLWSIVLKLLFIWALASSVLLMYPISSEIFSIFKYGFKDESVLACFGPLISTGCFVLTFFHLCFKKEQLKSLYLDVVRFANSVDRLILRRQVFYLTTILSLSVVCSCFIIFHSMYYFNKYFDFMYEKGFFNSTCYGLDYRAFNVRYFKTFIVVVYSALNIPSVVGIGIVQVLIYCFLTKVVAELVDICVKSVAHHQNFNRLEESLNVLKTFREKMLRVRHLVTRINRFFENVVLLWFGSTLFTCCLNITLSFKPLNYSPSSRDFALYMSMYLKDLALLMLLTIEAGSLGEKFAGVSDALLSFSCSSNLKRVLLAYTELHPQHFAFKAGSCFVITKKLIMSFVGLCITYTVIYIQFNPDVVRRLEGHA